MELSLYKKDVFEKYKSNSQIARILTEDWFEREMYCPSCLKEELTKNPNNTKVIDFTCKNCNNNFQLKAQNKYFSKKILDGAFEPMMSSIKNKLNPHFSIMHYSRENLVVRNLIIIPKFFFSESIIEKRKPLSKGARRSGWVGCNILLSNLPIIGQVKVIEDQKIISKNN